MKKKWMKHFTRLAVCAGLLACMHAQSAFAESELLARTELELHQGRGTAELFGERYKGGYATELLVILKDGDGRVLTAYRPSINGGYNAMLQAVQVKPVAQTDTQEERAQLPQQLLLSVGQGNWSAPTEYRVIDFSAGGRARELFGAEDSMGIVTSATYEAPNLRVHLKTGENELAPLPEGFDIAGRINYGGLHSLVLHDFDSDGQQELVSVQQLTNRKQVLADVGAVWSLQPDAAEELSKFAVADDNMAEDKQADAEQDGHEQLLPKARWKHSLLTIMTAVPVDRSNTINNGLDFTAGVVLPRKATLLSMEATYPVFYSGDLDLQDKVNATLQKEIAPYLERYYNEQGDMAFKIMSADENLLSIQLISSDPQGFLHHNVNVDLETGALLRLEDVLDVGKQDLHALLQVLCKNDKIDLSDGIPQEWYLEDDTLFLMERVGQSDEVAGFAVGNLHKYLRHKNLLKN